ncbi:MAG: hypothetical protein VX201_18965 [Pseudomonadota bacterium]|jgi:hypothetical protein|nr:hypothetical protein [Pseudomonadota bacterium]
MSDPVTNVEIEDVLASIRRLVSDEHGDESRRDAAVEAKADKLVLTPALRVATTEDAPQRFPEEEPPRTSFGRKQPGEAKPVETATDDAPEQAVEAEPTPLPTMQLGAEYAVSDPDEPQEDLAEAAEVAEGDEPVAPEVRLEDRFADLEAAVSVSDDQWEPDGNDEDAFGAAPLSMEWLDHTPQESVGGTEAEEAPFWEGVETLETSAEITALHHDVVEADEVEEVVDEVEEELDAADEGLEAAEHVDEAAALDEPAVAVETPVEESYDAVDPYATQVYDSVEEDAPAAFEDLAGLGLQDGILDEEMLRELVADIVRQELQGSLGERITRNVRKLVRREIQRALTARDLS